MLDPKHYRDVMSRFASGVTVVTTMDAGVPHGLTVSAFSSVSLSPPRVLICLGNDTDSKPLIDKSRCFAVHILGRDHVGPARNCSTLWQMLDCRTPPRRCRHGLWCVTF